MLRNLCVMSFNYQNIINRVAFQACWLILSSWIFDVFLFVFALIFVYFVASAETAADQACHRACHAAAIHNPTLPPQFVQLSNFQITDIKLSEPGNTIENISFLIGVSPLWYHLLPSREKYFKERQLFSDEGCLPVKYPNSEGKLVVAGCTYINTWPGRILCNVHGIDGCNFCIWIVLFCIWKNLATCRRSSGRVHSPAGGSHNARRLDNATSQSAKPVFPLVFVYSCLCVFVYLQRIVQHQQVMRIL